MNLIQLFNTQHRDDIRLASSPVPANSTTGVGQYSVIAASDAVLEAFKTIGLELVWRTQGGYLGAGEWRLWTGQYWQHIEDTDITNFLMHKDLFRELLKPHHKDELVRSIQQRSTINYYTFDQKPYVVFEDHVRTVENDQLIIKKHNRRDYLTIKIPIAPQPIPTPFWQSMLDAMLPDPDDQCTVQEMYGYCLFPSVQRQVFFVLTGEPQAGKGTIVEVLRDIIGADRASSAKIANFSDSHGLEDLVGKLINWDDETEHIDKRTDGYIKQISAGSPVQINPKGQKAFSIKLQCRLILTANDLAHFNDKTDALWSRIVGIRFERSIPKDQALDISIILDNLRPEYPGIIEWAIQGLKRVLARKGRRSSFTQSATSTAFIAEHKRDSNPHESWYAECIEDSPGARIQKSLLWDQYKLWLHANGYKPRSSSTFWKDMKRKGIQELQAHSGTRYYTDIAIRKSYKLRTEPNEEVVAFDADDD